MSTPKGAVSSPTCDLEFEPLPPNLRSVFQIQDLQSYVLAPLKNVFIPSFVPRVFWPRSTTFATTFTPPLAKDEIPIREEKNTVAQLSLSYMQLTGRFRAGLGSRGCLLGRNSLLFSLPVNKQTIETINQFISRIYKMSHHCGICSSRCFRL